MVSLLPPKPTSNLVETDTGEVVSAPKSGVIDQVFVEEGDEVQQGDPLVNVNVAGTEEENPENGAIVNAGNGLGIDTGVDDGNEIASVTGGAQANTIPVLAQIARKEGDVFYQGDAYYQALTNTQKGDDVSDTQKFMKITTWPNGQVQETKKRHSDIESFQIGEQIYYEGKYLQATEEVSPISEELGDNGLASRTYLAGEVIKYNETYFQAFQNLEKGTDISKIFADNDGNPIDVTAGSQALESLWVIGQELPSELNSKPEGQADEEGNITYSKGEIVSRLDTNNQPMYFLALNDLDGTNTPDLATSDNFVRLNSFVDTNVITFDRAQESIQFFDDQIYYDAETQQHFIVDAAPPIITDPAVIASFDPSSPEWSASLHVFNPKLNSAEDPNSIIRKKFLLRDTVLRMAHCRRSTLV